MTEEVVYLNITDIFSFGNVRLKLTDDAIQSLAADMADEGQLIPVHVYQSKGKYVLKYGHRRLAAAKLLGWKTVQAIIVDAPLDEISMIISQYNENENRLGLSYMDKAYVYSQLKQAGYNQKDIAKYFGISDAAVSLALAALDAPKKLQDAIDTGELSPSAVEPLLSLDPEEQEKLVDVVLRAKTVKKVSEIVNAQKQKKALKNKQAFEVKNRGDIDPLEEAAADALNDAVVTLRSVAATGITHPALVRKVRPTVEELVRQAASLKKLLDGDTWDDTKDLA